MNTLEIYKINIFLYIYIKYITSCQEYKEFKQKKRLQQKVEVIVQMKETS